MATSESTTLSDGPLPAARLNGRPVEAMPPQSDHVARGAGLVGFVVRTATAVAVFDVAVWVAVNALIPLS